MALRREEVLDVLHHAVGSLHREGNLRYEAHVHGPRRQRRVHGDEAGLAAHELDDSHAVERGLGLNGSRLDGLLRLLHGGVEAECFVDVEDVVVNRLRDATNTMLIPCRSMESTIFGTSPPPRPQPTMEPPRSCTQNTTSVH